MSIDRSREIHRRLEEAKRRAASGDRSGALRSLLACLALSPRDPVLLRDLASMSLDLGNHTLALEALQSVVRRAPKDVDAWVLIGRVHAAANRPYEAEASLRQALKMFPLHEGATRTLVDLYGTLGGNDHGHRLVTTWIAEFPEAGWAHLWKARLLAECGIPGRAIMAWEDAQAAGEPETEIPRLAKAKEEAEALKERMTSARERVGQNPQDRNALWELCHGLSVCADVDRALEMADRLRQAGVPRPRHREIRARVFVENDRYDEALLELEEANRVDPDSATVRELYRRVIRRGGEAAERQQLYRTVLRRAPETSLLWKNLGIAHLEADEPRRALAALRRAGALEPKLAEIDALVGRAWLAVGDLRRARTACEAAVQKEAKDADLWSALGDARMCMGDLPASREAFRRALLIEPDYDAPHHGLGRIAYEQGEFDVCVRECRLCIDANPSSLPARRLLLRALVALRKLDEAMEECFHLLDQRDDPVAQIHLAEIYDEKGEDRAAQEAYEKLLKIAPEESIAHRSYAVFLSKRGRYREAVDAFRKCLDLSPLDPGTLNDLGLTLRNAGRPEEAAKVLRRAIGLRSGQRESVYNLGLAYSDLGKWREALRCLRRAEQEGMKEAQVFNEIGWCLEKLGRVAEAATQYRRALEANANQVNALLHLSRLFATAPNGKWVTAEEAKGYLERALMLAPRRKQAQWLRRCLEKLERRYPSVMGPATVRRVKLSGYALFRRLKKEYLGDRARLSDIAKRLGAAPVRVEGWLREFGITGDRKLLGTWLPDYEWFWNVLEFGELAEECFGKPTVELADLLGEFGVTPESLREHLQRIAPREASRWCTRLGIPLKK